MKSSQPWFSIFRILLFPFALIYGTVLWLRNRLYDSGFYSSVEFSTPVISVGNLSVGGTGKTPHVEFLLDIFRYEYKMATLSRGYKRRTQGFLIAGAESNAVQIGDEPMQYHVKYPEVTVCVAEERLTAIPLLLQKRPDLEMIVLDDAFQHRSVKAGLQVLITDYNRPFYKDFILPYGRLREGRKAYQRATDIIVSKCPPALSREAAAEIARHISPVAGQRLYFTTLLYGKPYDFFTGRTVETLLDKNVLLVCGIARPEPLAAHLETGSLGVHTLTYADHHYFLSDDVAEISETFQNWKVSNKVIVTTEKDAARLRLMSEQLATLHLPILVQPIKVEMLFGQREVFVQQVRAYADQALEENHPNNWFQS